MSITCRINNLYKKTKKDYPNYNFEHSGIVNKNINILDISHTGLGNNLFEICDLLSVAWKFNLEYQFPDLNLLFQKIPEYPISFYRNIHKFQDSKNKIPIDYKNLERITISKDNYYIFRNRSYSYHNFNFYRNRILKLFEIDSKSKDIINNKYQKILNTYITISIHIRRSDFLKISEIWNPDYILKNTYFIKAIENIKTRIKSNFKFLIFSDDITWCKTFFKGEEYIFIEDNYDYIDLWLMTLCNHNIISNSSFSWWGAYLNQSKTKIIIAPEKSIFKERKNCIQLNKQLYPKNWIILKE